MAKSKLSASNSADQKTLDLIALVTKQKGEIAEAERPQWKTNCSFSFLEGRATDTVNLHVETDLRKLIRMAAWLKMQEHWYDNAADVLSVLPYPRFEWGGSSVDDWLHDIRLRIGRLQLADKRKKLEALESRLNAVVSPELRAKLELEAIAAELEGGK